MFDTCTAAVRGEMYNRSASAGVAQAFRNERGDLPLPGVERVGPRGAGADPEPALHGDELVDPPAAPAGQMVRGRLRV